MTPSLLDHLHYWKEGLFTTSCSRSPSSREIAARRCCIRGWVQHVGLQVLLSYLRFTFRDWASTTKLSAGDIGGLSKRMIEPAIRATKNGVQWSNLKNVYKHKNVYPLELRSKIWIITEGARADIIIEKYYYKNIYKVVQSFAHCELCFSYGNSKRPSIANSTNIVRDAHVSCWITLYVSNHYITNWEALTPKLHGGCHLLYSREATHIQYAHTGPTSTKIKMT